MKRLKVESTREDERGLLIQVNTGEWKQVNRLIIKKGNSFGGHYHKHTQELFYLLQGKVKVNLTEEINPNECFLINPPEKHTIYAIEDSELIVLLSEPFNKGDIWKE